MEFMRTSSASIALATTVLVGAGLLTGCSAQQLTAGDVCESPFNAGALSKNISVLGEFGSDPVVNIPDDIEFNGAQAHTVHRAEDRSNAITEPSLVSINYAIVESSTNEIMAQSESFANGKGSDTLPVIPGAGQNIFPGGLQCAAPGDRVVLTLSPAESQQLSAGINPEGDSAFAIVVDVHHVQPITPQGTTKNLPAGFPGVITDETGQPGVIATPNEAPSDTRAAVRIEGSGEVITDESFLVANMLQVSWQGWRQDGTNRQVREPFLNTYTSSGPIEVGDGQNSSHPIREALNGYTVGSQVVVIVPDEEYDAMVYVVDILSAV